MTPLAQRLRARIAASGPVSVEDYMQFCLADAAHGYYMTRDPIGMGGDFTTAPEISQMFGEMIGIWLVNVWQTMGAPDFFHLAEFGPGRGTLMADVLRTAKIMPEFLRAAQIHLVETSPVLRARQRSALEPFSQQAKKNVHWHESMTAIPQGPILVVANEFFDALPVRQFQHRAGGWFERMVNVDATGRFVFELCATADNNRADTGPEDAIAEQSPAGESIMAALARRMVTDGGAALIIDYGHAQSGFGDTLQAVKRHAFADVFAEPGEADLTTHVDFARLGEVAQKNGAVVQGLTTQGAFLRAMGIEPRAQALARNASESQRTEIMTALDRLTGAGEHGMGELFKVMAVAHPDLPQSPGF